MTFPLQTPRLLLRLFEERDIEPFALYRSDPEVARYQGWEAPFSLDRSRQFVTEMKTKTPGIPGEWLQIALELRSGGEMIGDCAFQCLPDEPSEPRQAEIAFTIAPHFQGQGYAREAVARLLDYLFGDLKLHRVRANCDPENEASARLLTRVGMRCEGEFLESLWYKGRWASEVWYAILEREWSARMP